MIIFGYPGVGKTSIAKEDWRFIDLDSSDMLIHGKYGRKKHWEENYCNIALLLSRQGYYVFVSTHPEVISRIMGKTKDVCAAYPDICLQEPWTKALKERYQDRRNRPSHNAWRRAKDHFEEDIRELHKLDCVKIPIPSMDFNLKKTILAVSERG